MSEVGRLVPRLCSSHKPSWDCQAGGVGEDIAAGAVVPTGSLKKKKKNHRSLGSAPTRSGLPRGPASAVLSPPAGCRAWAPGLWFHFAATVSVSSCGERRTRRDRAGTAGAERPPRPPAHPVALGSPAELAPHPTHCLPRQG